MLKNSAKQEKKKYSFSCYQQTSPSTYLCTTSGIPKLKLWLSLLIPKLFSYPLKKSKVYKKIVIYPIFGAYNFFVRHKSQKCARRGEKKCNPLSLCFWHRQERCFYTFTVQVTQLLKAKKGTSTVSVLKNSSNVQNLLLF